MNPENPNDQQQVPSVYSGSGVEFDPLPPPAPESQPPSVQFSSPPPPEKKSHFNLGPFSNPWFDGLTLLIVAAIIIAVAIVLLILTHKPAKKIAVIPSQTELCFVRTAHLDCIDKQNTKRTRFNIPVPPGGLSLTNLVPSADRSIFLGYSTDDPSPNDIWILNNKLKVTSELNLPNSLTASDPSWSRDDQSILMAMINPQNSQQIYRYTPSSNNLQQLTSLPQNTATPYETRDGHILFGVSAGGGTWRPYIMGNNGGSPQPLGDLSPLTTIRGFDYDPVSDTIFVYGNYKSGEAAIVYGSVSNFLDGGGTHTIAANVQDGDSIGLIDGSTIIIGHNSLGTIINLSDPSAPIKVTDYGNLVGMLSLQNFKLSSQQVEQPFERIANLSNAPSSFASYIEPVFTKNDKACQANAAAQKNGEEYTMSIIQVANTQYATVLEGCGPTVLTYYALNSSGNWTQVFEGSGVPKCKLINEYNFPASIFPQCINPDGKLVVNDPQSDLLVSP